MLHQRRRAPRVTVVDRVSLAIHAGEVFGVLGPNGAGKTTLFKMLSTMIVPDEGSATVDGYDVVQEAAAVRSVLAAVSADERSLNWRLTARENLELFAALHKLPRAHRAQRVDFLLPAVGLAGTGAKLVGSFSSGMRQRLLIARALLGEPRILLLDEPTRSLDPISAHDFRDFLRRELIERAQCTIVLATHNAEEAFRFCDRVAVLHHGRVLATGPTSELAAKFGEERYRLLTSHPDHTRFSELETRGVIRARRTIARDADDWSTVECVIAGGTISTAKVIQDLVAEGVPVARFERAEPSLAELIARIIAASPPEAHDA